MQQGWVGKRQKRGCTFVTPSRVLVCPVFLCLRVHTFGFAKWKGKLRRGRGQKREKSGVRISEIWPRLHASGTPSREHNRNLRAPSGFSHGIVRPARIIVVCARAQRSCISGSGEEKKSRCACLSGPRARGVLTNVSKRELKKRWSLHNFLDGVSTRAMRSGSKDSRRVVVVAI